MQERGEAEGAESAAEGSRAADDGGAAATRSTAKGRCTQGAPHLQEAGAAHRWSALGIWHCICL